MSLQLDVNGQSSAPNGSVAVGDVEIRRALDGSVTSRDQFTLGFSYVATGQAGSVIDLADADYTITADGGYSWSASNASTRNLITYQGDLNYDGRVSMQDLAFLNAGAQQVAASGVVAHDVDADFNGLIDLADLAVLDADWEQSLHTGPDSFMGSGEVSIEDLQQQGVVGWSDTSFQDQNLIEAAPDFVGTLDTPFQSAVVDGDGLSEATPDIQAAGFQDSLAPLALI